MARFPGYVSVNVVVVASRNGKHEPLVRRIVADARRLRILKTVTACRQVLDRFRGFYALLCLEDESAVLVPALGEVVLLYRCLRRCNRLGLADARARRCALLDRDSRPTSHGLQLRPLVVRFDALDCSRQVEHVPRLAASEALERIAFNGERAVAVGAVVAAVAERAHVLVTVASVLQVRLCVIL